MNTIQRKFRLLLLLTISFFIVAAGSILDQIVRLSDFSDGFENGVFYAILTSIIWLLFICPVSLIIYGLYRWRGWSRFISLAVLSPAIIVFGLCVSGSIFHPSTAANRLWDTTGVTMPATARDVRHHYTSAGFDGSEDTYYFRCSPEDTDRLIHALQLEPLTSSNPNVAFDKAPFPNWPDPATWHGSVLYSGDTLFKADNERGRFFSLRTDSAREQVYLHIDNY